MPLQFRNPSDDSDDSEDLISDVIEIDGDGGGDSSPDEFDENMEDSDDSDEDYVDDEETTDQPTTSRATRNSSCDDEDHEHEPNINNINEDEEDDDTVKAIIASIKKPRTVPLDLELDEFITDISFHPTQDILAAGLINGDIQLIKYSNEENEVYKTMEVHTKACRDLEFSDCGKYIISGSKDKSVMITDIETEKLKKFYEEAHTDSVNKIFVLDENVFFSGDDSGYLKMWDLRTNDSLFSLHEVEDQITAMTSNPSQKMLVFTSSDGYLTSINIGSRKMFVQSEPYQEELTCIGLFRKDSKLAVGTSKGKIYTFNWGQFGYHCDEFPGLKIPISFMTPLTDRIAALAGEDGHVRACHIAPFKNLGIIGQHSLPVEAMDINCSGQLIATASHNNDIRFWNVNYFEDFEGVKFNEKHNKYKEKMHNLPSSKYSNAGDFFSDLGKDDD